MKAIVNNLSIDYISEGSSKNPTLLLLHGWGSTKETFKEIIVSLSNKHYVIALDLPGFGASQKPENDFDAHDYAKLVADFLAKKKLQPNIVIGHSMGGQIAIAGLGNNIFPASKLILIASAGVRSSKSLSVQFKILLSKILKPLFIFTPASTRKKILLKVGATDSANAGAMKQTLSKILADDIQNDAKNVAQQTLLIYGSDDTATPPSFGRQLAALIPTSRYVQIENAGHFTHQTHANKVLKLVEEFLHE